MKLSSIIEYKLPQFVQNDHQLFVAFIQSYFTHIEEPGNWLHYISRFQRNLDIDEADSDFLTQYLDEFASTFPKVTQIPVQHLLKLMREFYLAKGSEDSFRFVFRILYDAEIEVVYPRDFLYAPSSGNYVGFSTLNVTGDNWVRLEINNDDLSAVVVGNTTGSTAIIDSITSTLVNGQLILSLELSSFDGNFDTGEVVSLTVEATTVTETVLGSVQSITITDGGTNYESGDLISITDPIGIHATAEITKFANGPLNVATILSPGTNYVVGDVIRANQVFGSVGYGFRAEVNEVGVGGDILKIQITDGGYVYSQKTSGVITSTIGTGGVIELNGDNIGKIESIQVTDGGIDYLTTSISIASTNGVGVSLTPVISGVYESPKRYIDDKSTPSGTSKILDSFYYQKFSYALKSSISPHVWIDQIKRIAHPAGSALFGIYSLESTFDLLVSLAPGFSSSFDKKLRFLEFVDLMQPLTTAFVHRKQIKSFLDCTLGLRLNDIEHVKFLPAFDWQIIEFGMFTIEQVGDPCLPINKQEIGQLTIT